MKPHFFLSASLLSAVMGLSLAQARADDAATLSGPSILPPSPPPAQVGGTPAPARGAARGHVLADLTAKLSLTPDQQRSVGALIADARAQARALHDDDTLSLEDKHQRMMDVLNSTRAQVRAVLTTDQQKVFDALPRRWGKPGAK